MDDLNRSTNRLRRKFDETANYLETKVQMEQVMDSARKRESGGGEGSRRPGTKLMEGFAREYQ